MNFLQRAIQSHKIFYRYIRRKGLRRFFKENTLDTAGSNKTKALSVALGIFVGLTPLWGFHTVIVLFLATVFRLNKVISYMSTHISFPPFVPFIIMASLWIGAPFVGGNHDFSQLKFTMETVKENFIQYLIGSTVLATSASVLLGFATFFLLNWFRPNK